jgi:hypothetical protein
VSSTESATLGRAALLAPVVVALSIAGMAAATLAGGPVLLFAALAVGTATIALGHRTLFSWRSLTAVTLLVILLIPIRRYALPGQLPFEVEPYRVLIALVMMGWIGSLLVDPRVRLRRTPLDWPLAMVLFASFASVAVNSATIDEQNVASLATKQLTFLASFAVIFYLVVSVVRTLEDATFLLTVLVYGGCLVAAFGLVELATGYNVFNHLDRAMPFLQQTLDTGTLARGGRLRVFGSAQHPIALGSMLVLAIPPAIYLAGATGQRRWLAAIPLLGFGALATVSRTAILSLVVIGVVYLILRPRQTLRYWPLVIPALVVVHVVMPGMIGTIYKGFFPEQGLIAEQADGAVGSSRVASLSPALDQVEERPLFGSGFGARVPSGPDSNSFIVDDQWLATAMETGLFGVFAWAWLFLRFLRRSFGGSRPAGDHRAALLTALSASIAGFAVGMFTYDAFSFIQVTFVAFVLLAVGCVALGSSPPARQRSRQGIAAQPASW